ncbi:MAG: hypothetical protein DWQ31_16960 [Planctomycetota bacterium]|nr:MAG: hypothetical protein DWQ31_16960 [Planctomycetota bacterium]REJ92045.1 MAG: hypothetical protein DWQ35_12910 [Planctomycetota bacterium]REK28581.1 MAG: hypothetical protein DWQ42_04500 [Planctomycetota bacterium]REK39196.1 MAG: hypothetical protein DWQ46_18085 [Planctomycetota bacterium]
MKFKGTLRAPRVNLASYRAELHKRFSELIVEAAHQWLDATVVSLIPVWSGASVATFHKLARSVNFALTAGHRPIAPDRRAEGMRNSEGGLAIDRQAGTYHFEYGTTLDHLIYNELNNANVSPDATLFARLLNPGPYKFQEAGVKAFRRIAERASLPDPRRHFKTVVVKV